MSNNTFTDSAEYIHNVRYGLGDPNLAIQPSDIVGTEYIETNNALSSGDVVSHWVFDGTMFKKLNKNTSLSIPTPRLWARNGNTSQISGTDVNNYNTLNWSIPALFAQQFSEDTGEWRNHNPVYELMVHKFVTKRGGDIRRSFKWVHPVHKNQGATGKKYAGGSSYSNSTGGAWTDRITEWSVDTSTKPTPLLDFNPHDWYSFNGNTLANAGQSPIIGAWSENDFDNRIYFPNRKGRTISARRKMPISVRIRIDNPNFIPGQPNQEPYLYGDISNIIVVRPRIHNFWDGVTVDEDGANVLFRYFFDFIASEENSAQ